MKSKLRLTAIVAMTQDRVIGKKGTLPWLLPEDLRLFKRHTTGHPVLMGRKTWDSIGFPLPNRQSIVLTRNTTWSAEGTDVIHTPDDLKSIKLTDSLVYIIGGAQIYDLFMPQLDEILVSRIYGSHSGDTCFPEFESQFPHFTVVEKFDAFELRRYTR